MLRNYKINLSSLFDRLTDDAKKVFKSLLAHPAMIDKLNQDFQNTLVTKISRREAEAFLNQSEIESPSHFYSFIFMLDEDGMRTPYVVGDLIGRGGNGIIKSAYNLITGEHVALKIDRGFSDKTEDERAEEFACEKDVLLNYNNAFRDELVRVSSNKKKVFYLAEEFIPGKTLEAYMFNDLSDTLRTVPRTSVKCIGIARTVMEIIGISLINICKFHNMGYVHRDIKPSNIMIIKNHNQNMETDSEIENIRFIDFGGTDKDSNRERSIKLGTVAYFPPEFNMNSDKVVYTKESDIYSLGKTFQELFTLIASQNTNKISLFFRNNPSYKMLLTSLSTFFDEMTATDSSKRLSANNALAAFYNIWKDFSYNKDIKDLTPSISISIIDQEFLHLNLESDMQKKLHLI